jgi:hypothetical protein
MSELLTSNQELIDRVCRGVGSIQEGIQLRVYIDDLERRAGETSASTGCRIHGRCPVCAAMDALGDPRVGVQIAGPDAGAVFRMGATLHTVAPNAAAAAQPGVFAWVCTKHGNIPFQDCEQCAAEARQVKTPLTGSAPAAPSPSHNPMGSALSPDIAAGADSLSISETPKTVTASASTGDNATPSRPSPSPVECPKCRTQLAFEGDECGLCKEEER